MGEHNWDKIFAHHEWGKYPCEELIRFMAWNYYKSKDRKNIKVLEVGCGPGVNLWYLAREGFNATGIDGSSIAIARAKKWLKREGLKAQAVIGDAKSLQFPDNTFDCVIDNECIYSNALKDAKIIIDEVYRVLKPGGLFYMKTFAKGMNAKYVKHGVGPVRLTGEKDAYNLCRKFKVKSIDYSSRTEKNRDHEIKEMVVISQKG